MNTTDMVVFFLCIRSVYAKTLTLRGAYSDTQVNIMANLDSSILEKIFAENGNPLTDDEKARLGISAMSTEEPEVEEDSIDEAEIDDDDIPLDGIGEEIPDDSSDEADTVEPVQMEEKPKPVKNLDAKEKKIVRLKDKRKTLLSENRELKAELETYRLEKRRAELRAQYGSEHDDVSADILTETAINREQTSKQIEALTFMATNPDIMIKYPDAKQDVERIMALAKSTSATPSQVCAILYGETEPLEIRRAKASVKGELPKSPQNYSVNNAGNTTVAKARTVLTNDQRESMKTLQKMGFTFADESEYLKLTTH